jgi:hypothetical protein
LAVGEKHATMEKITATLNRFALFISEYGFLSEMETLNKYSFAKPPPSNRRENKEIAVFV